jgi:hypothetical protein
VSDDGLPNPPGAFTTTWSKVSGPGTVTFGNTSALQTTASFSTSGSYTLRLSANDGALSGTDTVVVTVSPVPPPPRITITSPLPGAVIRSRTVTVAYRRTGDLAGVDHLVVQLDGGPEVLLGPSQVTGSHTFSGLGQGWHTVRLTLADTAGQPLTTSRATATRSFRVANSRPVVSAGADQAIVWPSGTALTGAVTDDGLPEPPAMSLLWSKVSGPGTATFGSPSALSTGVTFSKVGTYVLRLRAGDGQLARADSVKIRVEKP